MEGQNDVFLALVLAEGYACSVVLSECKIRRRLSYGYHGVSPESRIRPIWLNGSVAVPNYTVNK